MFFNLLLLSIRASVVSQAGKGEDVMSASRSREKRWVVISEDGRYVTLGRTSDPSETEIQSAEESLRAQGLAGWLAVMAGNPYEGALPEFMEVKPLAAPTASFKDVRDACVATIAKQRRKMGS
jgi:hypothetical protein